jgi:acyl-CoA synthetase (AMP-forming)/AMP-acid ligase II
MVDPSLKQMKNKLSTNEGRLDLVKEVTKDGMLALEKANIRGNDYFVFKDAPKNLRDYYQLGLLHGDWTHIVYEDERYQFAETLKYSNQLANTLQSKFNIQKGDKVALSMRNYPEWMFSYIAATSIGAVIVPLNSWWKGDELEYGITNSEAKIFIGDEERLDRINGKVPNIPRISVRSNKPENLENDFYKLIEDQPHDLIDPVSIDPEDDASIMYTSGSTGYPKGVVLTHRGITFAPLYWVLLQTIGKQALEEETVSVEDEIASLDQPATLVAVPLFHVTGSHAIFLLSIPVGRKTVLMYKWDAEKALDTIEKEKISAFTGVPTMSAEIVEAQVKNPRDISTLKDLLGGGAPRPPEQVKKQNKHMPNASPGIGYGLTETNALGANNNGETYLDKPTSTGFPLPLVMELRVIDDNGNVLKENENGEVCIKSAATFRCYWKNQEATDECLDSEGWFKTGDIGFIDEDGFLFINDRKKDMVIRGGENIACPEVEAAIAEHPAVLEASVFGIPDERLGEILATNVCIREEASLNEIELASFLSDKLANFKVPAHFWFQTEKLPRIASGKIAKKDMRAAAIELMGK